MAYLLDTCTISEMVKKKPEPKVVDWFKHQEESSLFLSIISWGEIQNGIYRLPTGKRRVGLEKWLNDELHPLFERRIVNVDEDVITTWAKMTARLRDKNIVRHAFDSLIEATAIHRNLILVTRNEKDFRSSDVSIYNPWSD